MMTMTDIHRILQPTQMGKHFYEHLSFAHIHWNNYAYQIPVYPYIVQWLPFILSNLLCFKQSIELDKLCKKTAKKLGNEKRKHI